jgi:hypothetical protein
VLCVRLAEGEGGARKSIPTEWVFSRARICKLFKEPRNPSTAGRAGTTTLFDERVRQATLTGGIDSLESISGLLQPLQIRA